MHGFNHIERPRESHLTKKSGKGFELSVWRNMKMNNVQKFN